jgi:hypothetical protein
MARKGGCLAGNAITEPSDNNEKPKSRTEILSKDSTEQLKKTRRKEMK